MTLGEYIGDGRTTVVLSMTRVVEGREDMEGARAAEDRPPARPPLRAATISVLPKSKLSAAIAGGTAATLAMMNAAAMKLVATFFTPSSWLMWSEVEEDRGEGRVANPATPETHRRTAATDSFILRSCL